jgi:hypothetical protein
MTLEKCSDLLVRGGMLLQQRRGPDEDVVVAHCLGAVLDCIERVGDCLDPFDIGRDDCAVRPVGKISACARSAVGEPFEFRFAKEIPIGFDEDDFEGMRASAEIARGDARISG